MSYSRKTNVLRYEYQLSHAAVTRIISIKDPGVFFHSKSYFHIHVDFLFSEGIKLLGLIRSITLTFSSLDCLYVLYFTLVRSKLEYASSVGTLSRLPMPTSSSTSSRSLRPSVSIVFSPHVPYAYTVPLEKLSLHFYVNEDITLMLFFFVQVCRGLESCTSFLENVSLRVSYSQCSELLNS
jgi:hypothetical protein